MLHTSSVARPKGTTKPPEEHAERHTFRFPPKLWERFLRLVPKGRSKFLHRALAKELDALEGGETSSPEEARNA